MLLLFGIAAMTTLKSKGIQCLNNPFNYSVQYAQEVLDGDLRCSCNLAKQDDILSFIYSSNGFEPVGNTGNPRTQQDLSIISKLNLSLR